MGRTLSVLMLATAAAACGHSQATVRDARNTTYDCDFATVWNAVTEEMHERFPDIPVEDPVKGVIASNYIRIQLQDDAQKDYGSQTAGRLNPGQTSYGNTPFYAFRMSAEVRGIMQKKGPPYRISVDGEVAEYKPGMAQLVPIKHGQADEPAWVQNRIDSAVMDIHNRLKKFAVKREIPKSAIASKTHDTTPWADLPDPKAALLIDQVHGAALARDAHALRPTMLDDFRWGLGGEGSADTAVALWAADPSKMKELARALEDGCFHEENTKEVVCPKPGSKATAMARFRKVGDSWKFAVFIAK
jgi:hypothetical protein